MAGISSKITPYLSVSTESMEWNKTGAWRYLRPAFQNKLSPCMQGCPAGENVESWVKLIPQGKYMEAYQLILEENPFPGVCGRVCFHPCEEACNRQNYDRAISINALERFLSDYVMGLGISHTGKATRPNFRRKGRVAIVGSGPAGLSCGYHLARLGYETEVFERWPKAGGVLRYGIPSYRLPKGILDWEIEAILANGIKLHTNMDLGRDFRLEEILAGFQAIFIATGLARGKKIDIPGRNNKRVLSGIEFLRKVSLGERINLGERVAVIGGGNTAIDSARSLLRLGAHSFIIYRRSRAEMPAYVEEIEEAEREGVEFYFLSWPERIVCQGEKLTGVQCLETELSGLDSSGRKGFTIREGRSFFIPAEGVVVAVGEESELNYRELVGGIDKSCAPDPEDNRKKSQAKTLLEPMPAGNPRNEEILSLKKGIFQGGDLISSNFSVPQAVASGKKVAILIDLYLQGERDFSVLENLRIGESGGISMQRYIKPSDLYDQDLLASVARYDDLNLDYFSHAERKRRSKLPLGERRLSFKEVTRGLALHAAMEEANRCFHCGVCNHCDNCMVYCPDMSIISSLDQEAYRIDLDHCKGCGICVNECPRAAMVIQGERQR